MDTTFITIHGKPFPTCNLSRDASIRYASESIQVVLGYQPHEVLNRSCWEYFHPQELPFARSVHGRGDGSWVGCECVFTVVYDVLIASTTVYGRGKGSQNRAVDAPVVRHLFDSSPNDSRYHMLTLLSSKFSQRLEKPLHEPRAAMFVNRFTRTATIMYATSGVSEILGLGPSQLISKSFFYCIQERCLRDAVRCLESAKANDSIAYLRFWFRNPMQDDNPEMAQRGLVAFSDPIPPLELEAVVSCTSDGLVVILRRSRAPIPTSSTMPPPSPHAQENIDPNAAYPEVKTTLCRDDHSSGSDFTSSSSVPSFAVSPQPGAKASGSGGPPTHSLMDTIREVAVFAWGIVGINRSLEQYKCGTPTGNAQPADATFDDNWGKDAAAGRG
ncbi:hypothetical protein N7486_010004 [Penicillium sp. IBT 16267x]|nr:hypothetical protein N7486_010004 [Penicillium sp. IBT 16267x]